MKSVKFKKAGLWAEMDPRAPQLEVKEGETVEVSDGLAEVVVEARRGTIVVPEKSQLDKAFERLELAETVKLEATARTKGAADKVAAEKNLAAADKELVNAQKHFDKISG